jgi:3-phenylpropionate/trans-cinnamate dioxygenase ferredoxin subunit
MTAATSAWTEVATVADFAERDRKLITLGDAKIGLFHSDGNYYAISAWCSHQRASMFQGEVCDGEIECPLHGARFDLQTGRNLCLPAVKPVPVYEVKVEDGRIFIKA